MAKLLRDEDMQAPAGRAAGRLLSDEDMMGPPERSDAARALRAADFASKGFLDRAAEIVAAPADLIWQGAEALGLPTPGVSAADTLKGYVGAVGNAMNSVVAPFLPSDMGPNRAETTGEKFAEGAGRGVADAGSMILPGMAAARLGQAGGLVQRVGTAAAQQPVMQAVSGAVGGGVGEATDNPWLGLAASLAVPSAAAGAKRLKSPVASQLTDEEKRLVQVAQAENIPLTPANITGSRVMNATESTFGTIPWTAGRQKEINQAQQAAFNRAALERINEGGTSLAPDVLDRARQRISNDFERMAAQTTVVLDQPFMQDVLGVVQKFANRLEVQRRPIFERFVQDIIGTGGPAAPMNGRLYQTVRSDLSRFAKNSAGNDPTLAQALRGLRDALDEAAERSVPANLRGDWREARRQWGNYKILTKAMSNSTTAANAGNLSPTQLAQAVRQANPNYAIGAGEFNDLARVGTQFVRDNIPNSGTAERTMLTGVLTGGGLTGAAFDPFSTLTAAGAGFTTSKLLQSAYNSDWFKRRVLDQSLIGKGPQITRGLLGSIATGQGAGLLGDDDKKDN